MEGSKTLRVSFLSVMTILLCSLMRTAQSSRGDGSRFQKQCLSLCFQQNCSTPDLVRQFRDRQPVAESVFRWSCQDDCRYQCMWQTVAAFHKVGDSTPQFHGKWPFIRLWGIQEPASAAFSILNFIPHAVFLHRFRREVGPQAKMFHVWSLYSLVSMNTWFWSTVFHTRDFDVTEKMDYFCAFSIVTYSLMAFLLRLYGTDWNWKSVSACLACLAMFIHHIYRMSFVHFDYGYNMILNVSVGAVNSICWIAWSLYFWKTKAHAKYALVSVLLLNGTILLELLDFPPILWTFDSHSLWHLSTAPIHIVWYTFVLADCQDRQPAEDKLKLV
eukprot:snap_masked-scaffold309_size213625-processed-gene-1.19 protein:Tk02557 transcript:snap_masked-scaffold309_size213625-processed-gene-1.19-mRNA-1 annotation:"hypothetical protein CAPTEDRAFT_219496"